MTNGNTNKQADKQQNSKVDKNGRKYWQSVKDYLQTARITFYNLEDVKIVNRIKEDLLTFPPVVVLIDPL